MATLTQLHKNGDKVMNVPRVTQKFREAVNRCAKAEGLSQRDWIINAIEQAIKDSPLRLGIARIDQRLNQGVTSRPDEDAANAAAEPQQKGGAA
jgi:hypothetical protein